MKLQTWVALLLVLTSGISCGTSKVRLDSEQADAKGVLKLKPLWSKDKGKSVDFEIELVSERDDFISIPRSDFECEGLGEKVQAAVITGFMSMDAEAYKNQFRDSYPLNPEEIKKLQMKCSFSQKRTGKVIFRIKNIYKNVSGKNSGIEVERIYKDLSAVIVK